MQLIVLGMHRSGTSVLARILNLMGAYFAPEGTGTGANQENPKGFWERRDVRALNDRVLHAVGCDWNRIARFDLGSLPDEVVQDFHARASKLVLEMDAHRPWFIKEPRLCLLLPLWREVLEAPVCIHIHRHPVEVAASLLTRNEMPIPAGLGLWEKYVSSAVLAASDLPSVTMSHRRLMAKPLEEAEYLHDELVALGVTGLRMPSRREISAFVDPALHRERSSRKDLRKYADELQVGMFNELESGALPAFGATLGEDVRERLQTYESRLPPMQAKPEPAKSADTLNALHERIGARDQENKMLREAVAQRDKALKLHEELHARDLAELGGLRTKVEITERDLAQAVQRMAAEIDERDGKLGEQTALVGELRTKVEITERDLAQAVQRMAAEIDERDGKLDEQTALVREFRQTVERQRQESEAGEQVLKEQVQRYQELLQQKEAEFTERTSELEAALRKARQELGDRFKEIAAVSRLLFGLEETLRNSLAARDSELALARGSLEEMRHSRAWRMTAPLRSMSRLFGRHRGADTADVGAAVTAIQECGLFDRDWYLRENADVIRSGMDPIVHYLGFGAAEGRNPGPDFDTAGYLERNPDVREAGMNPLLHYVLHGKQEGREAG